jgi:pimeloyl-ACP methyl ester carboxylesterase
VEPDHAATRAVRHGVEARVSANGLEIGYDALGAGPPLILLHGATSLGREDFGAQLPSFGEAFRCYVPDARGHGRTRFDVTLGLRYEDLIADVLAFADALGIATFHLLGFSMGGATALMLAARHPQRLRTLVVVGNSAEAEPRTTVIRRVADVGRVDAHDPAWAAALARRHDAHQGEGHWRRLLPAIVRLVETQGRLAPADLHSVDAPVMIAVGDRDPFIPVDQAWRLSRQLAGGRLFVAPDCGHEVASKRPILFNEACAGFYRSTEAVAARRAARSAGAGDR